jgi:VanZ family protein
MKFLFSQKLHKVLFYVYILILLTLLCVKFSDKIKIPSFFLGIPSDKWIHAILFFPFIILFRLGAIFQKELSLIQLYFLIALPFAAFCESLHYFIPYRTFSVSDFYANAIGLLIGTLISIPILRFKNKKIN